MSGLKNRFSSKQQSNDSIPIAETKLNKKPLSTSKFKDKSSGLNYNYEDRLSKMKLFKTSILMILLTITLLYFAYVLYIWFSNVVFDFYWHHLRGVRNLENPHFIRQIWIGNFTDLFYIFLKMFFAYFFFKYLNMILLLNYDDSNELEKYN